MELTNMETFIVYAAYVNECAAQITQTNDLQTAISQTPAGGHVEQTTDTGSVIVYQG